MFKRKIPTKYGDMYLIGFYFQSYGYGGKASLKLSSGIRYILFYNKNYGFLKLYVGLTYKEASNVDLLTYMFINEDMNNADCNNFWRNIIILNNSKYHYCNRKKASKKYYNEISTQINSFNFKNVENIINLSKCVSCGKDLSLVDITPVNDDIYGSVEIIEDETEYGDLFSDDRSDEYTNRLYQYEDNDISYSVDKNILMSRLIIDDSPLKVIINLTHPNSPMIAQPNKQIVSNDKIYTGNRDIKFDVDKNGKFYKIIKDDENDLNVRKERKTINRRQIPIEGYQQTMIDQNGRWQLYIPTESTWDTGIIYYVNSHSSVDNRPKCDSIDEYNHPKYDQSLIDSIYEMLDKLNHFEYIVIKVFKNNNIMLIKCQNYALVSSRLMSYCDRFIGSAINKSKIMVADNLQKFINKIGNERFKHRCYRCNTRIMIPYSDCSKCGAPYLKVIPLEKFYNIFEVNGYKFYLDKMEFTDKDFRKEN